MEWPIFWLLCAFFAAIIASAKNRSGGGWFLLGILFGPFALLVAAMPKLDDPAVEQARMDGASDEYRKCPFCAEVVRREALKCKHCSSDIVPLPPQPSLMEELGREIGKSFSRTKKKDPP